MLARAAVIVNPVAGNGRARRLWPSVSVALTSHHLAHDVSFTTSPGDATALAADAVRAGYEMVVAVGGDGTANEVANGLICAVPPTDSFAVEDDNSRPIFGLVACGSGCDLVKTLGIPRDVAGIDSLVSGRSRWIDAGEVSYLDLAGHPAKRYFINAADLGIGAEVTRRVNASSKRLGGFASFLSGALAGIIDAEFREAEWSFANDSADELGKAFDNHSGRVALIFIGNGRFAGGGMQFAPRARPDDGLFDVLIAREMSRSALMLDLLPRVYQGKHLGRPGIEYRTAASVRVSSPEGLLLEADGEVLGTTPVELRVVPRALRVAVP